MTHLALTDVSYAFAQARVDVTFSVESGQRLVLLGPSGCGKTTVLRLIAGLLKPVSGSIEFDGVSVVNDRPEDRGAVMVFQDHALFPFRTVGANVGYGLKMNKTPKKQIGDRVSKALRSVDLVGFEDRWPDDLSGGERQRVALARAIVVEPRILLLDEPLSSLDPELRASVRDTICDVQRRHAITTIMVTHDHHEARAVADTVVIMANGKVTAAGSPADVLSSSGALA